MRKTYAVSDETFKKIVSEANCIADILRALGLRVEHGPSYPVIRKRIAALEISTSHFDPKRYVRKVILANTKPLSEILVQGSTVGSSSLRKRLVREGVMQYRCDECGNLGEWQGKPLTLQLDHRNGDHHDNRLDNLRILCPNCHTQTPTHSWGPETRKKNKRLCVDCNQPISKGPKRCTRCAVTHRVNSGDVSVQPKIEWPSEDRLTSMVWEKPLRDMATGLGVSDNAIRKKCLKLNIALPPKGYWTRRFHGKTHEEALSPEPKLAR